MTYDPVTYWSKRTDLKDQGALDWVEDYIREHTIPDRILDYGTGTGAKIHLFKGMKVTGFDIVDTYKDRAVERALDLGIDYSHVVGRPPIKHFDTILVSKVLLHMTDIDLEMFSNYSVLLSKRTIVWDIDRDDGAEHVFNHDFSKNFVMKDVVRKDNQILFHT